MEFSYSCSFMSYSPTCCRCPSLTTDAMTAGIRRITGIPVVMLTYDGTGTYKNDIVVPYLINSKSQINSKLQITNKFQNTNLK